MGLQLTASYNLPVMLCEEVIINDNPAWNAKGSFQMVMHDEELEYVVLSVRRDGEQEYHAIKYNESTDILVLDSTVTVTIYPSDNEYGPIEYNIWAPENVKILRKTLYDAHLEERYPGRSQRYFESKQQKSS